jgi:hypothetical protein
MLWPSLLLLTVKTSRWCLTGGIPYKYNQDVIGRGRGNQPTISLLTKLSRRQAAFDKKLESANEQDIADEHAVCTMHVDDKSG